MSELPSDGHEIAHVAARTYGRLQGQLITTARSADLPRRLTATRCPGGELAIPSVSWLLTRVRSEADLLVWSTFTKRLRSDLFVRFFEKLQAWRRRTGTMAKYSPPPLTDDASQCQKNIQEILKATDVCGFHLEFIDSKDG